MSDIYCPNCWQTFPFGDWRMTRGASACFGCQWALVSSETRQRGFEAAMRLQDTLLLQRWADKAISPNRRVTAAKILRERGL